MFQKENLSFTLNEQDKTLQKVAVFIDNDNIHLNGRNKNILIEECNKYGRLVVALAYDKFVRLQLCNSRPS